MQNLSKLRQLTKIWTQSSLPRIQSVGRCLDTKQAVYYSVSQDNTRASLAETVYQHQIREHPWLYPYSRTVAFSKQQHFDILEKIEPCKESLPDLECLVEHTKDSLWHLTTDEVTSAFLDFTHIGLTKSHPLMTKLFLKIQSEWKSLDFISLGQYLSTIVSYNCSHILIANEILPQLRYILKNDLVKFDGDPQQFIQTLSQFTRQGLLQQLDDDDLNYLLSQISSVCFEQAAIIENDLDLVRPLFEVLSPLTLGDDRLTFIEFKVKVTCEKILKQITDIMLKNMDQLTVHQLCAIMAMSDEEQMEILAKSFLESIQSRTERVLMETSSLSSYEILELQQLANLSWMKLSKESRDRLLNLTLEYLKDNKKEESVPVEMILFLKHSNALSDLLLDSKFVLAKQALRRSVLDLDILQDVNLDVFQEIYDIVSMSILPTDSRRSFLHKCKSELLTNSFLSSSDKLRRLLILVLEKDINQNIIQKFMNEKMIKHSSLHDVKKLMDFATLGLFDRYHYNFVNSLSNLLCAEGRKQLQAQKDMRQIFLIGSGNRHSNTSIKLHGMPSYRLQKQFQNLNNPTGAFDKDILNTLTFLCQRDLDIEEFEVACLMVRLLPCTALPLLYHGLLNRAISNHTKMAAHHFRDVLQILVRVGRVTPNTDMFIQTTLDFLHRESVDTIDPSVLLEILSCLSQFKMYPRSILTKVFEPSFQLTKNTQDLSYNQYVKLMRNAARLNRAVCLKYPEYGVVSHPEPVESYLQQPVSKSAVDSDQHLVFIYLYKQCLRDTLAKEFGGTDFIYLNHITPKGLHTDVAVYFDENLDVMEHSPVNGNHYKKFAILCLDKMNFHPIAEGFTLDVEHRRELLEAEGFNVVLTSCKIKHKPRYLTVMANQVMSEICSSLGKIPHEVQQ
ncbi:uncharacterized protein [Argopecten irradians]|uniref:uncharacterized protein n=1 Tax=Argopecten irradians TaxID=31199 RepID=UPI003714132A